LSIVIVIVGLLIAGILAGQSLIESAKVNRVVKEFQQYEIGVAQFKEKFRYLPGDHPQGNIFSSQCAGIVCRGDGDGKIYRQVMPSNHLEVRNVWYHMQGAGFLNLNLPFTTTANQVFATWIVGNNFPKSTYSKDTMLVLSTIDNSRAISIATTNDVQGKLGIQIAAGGNDFQKGIIKPIMAMAIDQKIDDGVLNTGIIRSSSTDGNTPGTINCHYNSGGLKYNLAYTDDLNGCRLILILDNL
jgi:hypothetical protein